jgi:hypothetical protein
VTVDLTDPPDDPPPCVTQVVLWRLAVRVFRDHVARRVATNAPEKSAVRQLDAALVNLPGRCLTCDDLWPCRHRRLAERALASAYRPVRGRRIRNQAYLEWLRDGSDKSDMP